MLSNVFFCRTQRAAVCISCSKQHGKRTEAVRVCASGQTAYASQRTDDGNAGVPSTNGVLLTRFGENENDIIIQMKSLN